MMHTFVARRKTTGEFFTGSLHEGKQTKPIMCKKLENAMHQHTAFQLKDVLKTQVGGNIKQFEIVKVHHELSIVDVEKNDD